MSQENWKPIGWSRFFMVSDEGRVKCLPRKVRFGKNGMRQIPETILHPVKKSTGYLQVSLNKRPYLVHRLVAAAFCPGESKGLHVNHKNGVKDDNRACNLEWVTAGENMRHSYRELQRRGSCLGKFSGMHPTSKAVVRISKSGEETRYESGMDAVREGFRSESISRCCNGLSASHAGYVWRFAE
ncbi:NUMOD4 motif-containing HNH endonuclease [Achromobacter ruhlandii]|uniref:NUMOD4 motif-containing HNH endonuclease n=1 Tax=Achromobacter TaxID=222 RepID=UPI0015821259|nr:NUMOD4 motif-containing HNH endonuclease [Achromobacter dolens]